MAGHNMFTGRGKDAVPVQLEGEELAQALEAGDVQQDDEHGLDRIYIVRKMSYGQKQKLLGIASKMQIDPAQAAKIQKQGQAGMAPPAGALEGGTSEATEEAEAVQAMNGMTGGFDVGAYNTEQLVLNIVSWQGPSFVGVPVTRENILDLDPDNPLLLKVVQEIGRRNKKRQSPKL